MILVTLEVTTFKDLLRNLNKVTDDFLSFPEQGYYWWGEAQLTGPQKQDSFTENQIQ